MQPRLSLELLCGSAQVDPGDDAYFDPSVDLIHPKQAEVEAWARKNGIGVHVAPSIDGDEIHSDGYLYFEPSQAKRVAAALTRIGYPGDILDIKGALTAAEERLVRAVAEKNGWRIEMRNPATRIPFGGVLHGIPRPAEPRHITGLRSMKHLTWCCRCLGFDIYMVDGAKVAAQWADFVGGGHHLAYKFIPKRDIWIDKRVKEWPGFLAAHELLEALLMNVRGWSYERAHAAGNQIEQALRVIAETPGLRLQAALAPTWRYNLGLYFPGLEHERLDEMAEQAARQFWKYL